VAARLVTASLGAIGITGAAILESFPMLCTASLAFGSGGAAILLARYAAAELSLPEQRGRATSRVVTTVGAVAGPNLLAPAGSAAHAVGLPPLTGLYVVAPVMFACAAGILFTLLRPDPLRVAVAVRPRLRAGRHAESAPVPLRRLASAGAEPGWRPSSSPTSSWSRS
jgi:MFS family permease